MKKLKQWFFLALTTVVLTGCSLPGLGGNLSGHKTISITSGNTTEMQVVGYLVEGMINHYIDTETNVISNLGSSSMNHQAVMGGDADVSAIRYTGTSLTGELNEKPETDPDKALEQVKKVLTKNLIKNGCHLMVSLIRMLLW